jgi:hypothetical protein
MSAQKEQNAVGRDGITNCLKEFQTFVFIEIQILTLICVEYYKAN